MAFVHYRFFSQVSFKTVVFHRPQVTLSELKKELMSRENLQGLSSDLQVTDEQSQTEYVADDAVIPLGSSVIIRRIPIFGPRRSLKTKARNIERSDVRHRHERPSGASRECMINVAEMDIPEEEKLKIVLQQSYNYMNLTKKACTLHPYYVCRRCGVPGHHIRDCPSTRQKDRPMKKTTGIPRSFLVEVDDPSIDGVMMTSCGRYAIPAINTEVYALAKKKKSLKCPKPLETPEKEDTEPATPLKATNEPDEEEATSIDQKKLWEQCFTPATSTASWTQKGENDESMWCEVFGIREINAETVSDSDQGRAELTAADTHRDSKRSRKRSRERETEEERRESKKHRGEK